MQKKLSEYSANTKMSFELNDYLGVSTGSSLFGITSVYRGMVAGGEKTSMVHLQ
jgi:hypothetical protein